MIDRLVFATRNRGKLRELQALVMPLGIATVSLDDVGFTGEVVEDVGTFVGNARKKALEVAAATGMIALADDSGLEVDALGGEPGVESAHFGGLPRSDARNNRRLLDALDGKPRPWTARFRSVLVLARAGEVLATTEGTVEGEILDAPRGHDGFGYDPLFLVPRLGRTLAELGLDEKNRISHRARALAKMADEIRRLNATP